MEKNIKSNKPASFNLNEVFTLLKRILLIMLLFSVSRLGFYFFNIEHFPDLTFSRLLRILGGGLKFDISAVMHINSLYMFLFLLPFFFRYNKIYKNILKYLFFITNGIALAVNTMDFFYFDFILKRSTADVFMFAGEGNILTLFGLFLVDYWQGIIFWSVLIFIMIFFYNKTDIHKNQTLNKAVYYVSGTLWFMIIIYFSIIALKNDSNLI